MSLAIYVGSLTRYFCGDWELSDGPPERPSGENQDDEEDEVDDEDELDEVNPEELHQEVLEWRTGLSEALKPHLQAPLDWNEEAGSPYFTGAPSSEGLGSLMLWAAYAEHPNVKVPGRAIKKWYADPIFKRSTAEGSNTLFPNLLYACEWWLPCDIPGVMEVDFQDDEPFNLGSSLQLQQELKKLNSMTWKAQAPILQRWLNTPPGRGSSLEEQAKFALALLSDLTEKSVQHRLPMLLDA